MKMNNKYDWGDTVQVSRDAPQEQRPGAIASVCGITQSNEGVLLYLVEFSDGSSVEIPEDLIHQPTS